MPSSRGDPVDIGVIINSAERTVSIAGYETYPISDMTDAEIDFGSDDIDKQQIIMRGMGTFDRLSGSLTFTSRFDGLVTQFDHFNLRCKPTQRLY